MEDTQIEVESIIRRCSVEDLRKIASGMLITEDMTNKSRVEVMRAISETIDTLPDDDQKMETMKRIIPVAPKDVARKLCDILLGLNDNKNQQQQRSSTTDLDTAKLLQALSMNAASTFRRECKISGTIGDAGDSDNLDYVSLCGKIDDARKKKYKDEEIAIAVRNIVTANDLRSYLDARSDMSLQEMLKFICGWRKEKSAEKLHKELEKAFQGPTEDTVKFVVRVMKLREKIAIAAEAEGNRRYDEDTLRDDFFHALRTGLRDSDTKARIGALITRGSHTEDNVIMEQLKEIAAEEEEGKEKRGEDVDSTRRAKVSEVSVCASVEPKMIAILNKLEVKVDSLSRELSALKSIDEEKPTTVNEVSVPSNVELGLYDIVKRLEERVDSLTNETIMLRTKKKSGCEHCINAGKEKSCHHCFFCGAGDHKINTCPKKSNKN